MESVIKQTEIPDIKQYMVAVGERARAVARVMAGASTGAKNAALMAIAEAVERSADALLQANARDLDAGRRDALDAALLDRLELNAERVGAMAEGLRQIAALPDPVGEITDLNFRPSGIQVGKMRVPLGVIGIIYESRPNVTADAAGLCLKSGNAAILRGGSEAIHSNRAIAGCIHQGLSAAGLPVEAVQVIEVTDRAAVGELIRMTDYVDVIIPRGGKGLIERISREAKVPVIKHLHGVCHVYIDDKSDIDKAIKVAFNAKTQRYGTCNTMETLLVARGVAKDVLPELGRMYREKGVELRGCDATRALLSGIKEATTADWDTEYLAPILSIRIVDDLAAAMAHIHQHGSGHTEAIVTEDYTRARQFLREIDASSVMVNASTRLSGGGDYGMGAVVGICTDKLHARGPVGPNDLTSYKWIAYGNGHLRK